MDSVYLRFGLNGTFMPVTIVRTTETTDSAKSLNMELIITGVNEKKYNETKSHSLPVAIQS